MFFDDKKSALKYASIEIVAASIPGINIVIAEAAAQIDDSGKLNEFEQRLQEVVYFSAKYWLPAVCILPIALTFLLLLGIYELGKLCVEAINPPAPSIPCGLG